MEKSLKKHFQEARNLPDEHLSREIWQTICRQSVHNTWKKFWIFFILGISSGIIFVPVLKMLLADFEKSGFYEYLSLAFSSNGAFVS